MAESEHQFTIFDSASNQPMTVTVNNAAQNSEDAQAVQNIQYFTTPDGVPVTDYKDLQQVVAQADATFQSSALGFQALSGQALANSSFTQNSLTSGLAQPSSVLQSVVQQQSPSTHQAAAATPTQAVVGAPAAATGPTVGGTAIPQMLFLNQVTINGQTSYVLVDANNKPVQLPQGIQVINLPTQQLAGQSIQMPTADTGDEPLYVNAKQYHRILKRREARAKLESQGKIPKERQKYMYESRHKHAVNRVRGSGGVFVAGQECKEVDVNLQHAKNTYQLGPM